MVINMISKKISEIVVTCTDRQQRGYTLLQMAIALLTIGIITVAALAAYNVYRVQNSVMVTQESVENAVTKIQTYRQVYGHYPCPAPMGVARTDPNYGQSSNCLDATQAVGTCNAGLCYQSFSRAIDHDNDPLTADVVTAIRVRVGSIPFRNLQMDEKATFDGYDTRLTYAVTERMGDVTTFKELQGGIDIVDDQGQSLVEPAGSASFVVLSHGPNKTGAYSSIAGGQINPCAGAGLDIENCIDMAVPPAASRFLNTFESQGTVVFDDVVQYFATASNPMWRPHGSHVGEYNGYVG
jgi:type II secretory pathway pseudopilin PulG